MIGETINVDSGEKKNENARLNESDEKMQDEGKKEEWWKWIGQEITLLCILQKIIWSI